MSETNIPSEIRKEAQKYALEKKGTPQVRDAFIDGYLLASKTIDELEKKVNDLTMDNMTHEYNQAEAERTWPQFKQQIIDEWKTENNL